MSWLITNYFGSKHKDNQNTTIMYTSASSRVAVKNKLSSLFSCSKGVRQGCNLSPLLFSLFISDIESHLSSNRAGSITLTNLKVQLLLFADDLVLLADSRQGLQDSFDRLSEYCQAWKFKINIDKTKVVVFYKNQSYCHAPFLLMEFGSALALFYPAINQLS